MGKYMRKCGGIGELAVMEVSQAVGVRTRARTMALAAAAARGGASSKRRKAVRSAAEYQMAACLQLRSRTVVMTPRISRSVAKDSGGAYRNSRSSSSHSCQAAGVRNDRREVCGDSETAVFCFDYNEERRERSSSSGRREESDELESTAERTSSGRPTAVAMPSENEIEEFFAAAERNEAKRFANMYNYDVVNDVPLEGRYEWVQITPS